MKDFGNDAYSGDCFDTVGKLKGLDCSNPKDFVEILKIINRDLSLGMDDSGQPFSIPALLIEKPDRQPDITPTQRKAKPFPVVQQLFTEKETAFWKQYGITSEILKTYKVFFLREFKSENGEGKPFSFFSSEAEPVFAYQGKKHVKIYRPFSEIRFLYGGLLPENYCFGLEQLPAKGDTLFITGGEKDVLSLVSQGFHAICFNSETSNIPQHIIKKLSYRFKHVILLYDTDKTGQEASLKHVQQLSGLGVKRLVLPLPGTKQEKDISDYFRIGKTKHDFTQLFIEFLDSLYSETMAILKPCEIDFSHPPMQTEMTVSINGVPLGTQGNLLSITGGEGTGKSNYAGSLIAGTIRQTDGIDTLGTSVLSNAQNKAVLL
jgi:hypothetical protein